MPDDSCQKNLEMLRNIGSLVDLYSGRKLNSQQLLGNISKRSELFKRAGIQANDRVLLKNGDSVNLIVDLMALWTIEACGVPIDKKAPPNYVSKIIKSCEANFSVESSDEIISLHRIQKRQTQIANLILFTSGTSGEPKGVIHTVETVNQKLIALKNSLPINDFKNTLCMLPLNFGHGLLGNTLFPLLNNCNVFLLEGLSQKTTNVGQIIDTNQITFMSTVPSMWNLISGTSPPKAGSLKRVHCASSNLDYKTFETAKQWIGTVPFFNVYGLTELASWVSGRETAIGTSAINAVGHGWGAEFKILNPNEDGVGTVWIKCSSLTLGYLNDSSANNFDVKDGWFNSGDQGKLDSAQGLLLLGRQDNQFKRGGVRIQPEEIELILKQHTKVKDICVIPGGFHNDEVTAIYVTEDGALTSHELEKYARDYLPAIKIPSNWIAVEKLPLNERGKVDRSCLRGEFIPLEPVSMPELDFVLRKVFNVSNSFDLNSLQHGVSPQWDSIRHIDLFIKLSRSLNINFSPAEIVQTKSYDDLKKLIKYKKSE